MDDFKAIEARKLQRVYKDIIGQIDALKSMSVLPVSDVLDRMFEARDEIEGILVAMEAAGLSH